MKVSGFLQGDPNWKAFSVFTYRSKEGSASIYLWLSVPIPVGSALADGVREAQRSAVLAALFVKELLPCVQEAYRSISIAVVDLEYNQWFYGDIPIEKIPAGTADAILSSDLDSAAKSFDPASRNIRKRVPVSLGAPPGGSCSWADASARIIAALPYDANHAAAYFSRFEDENNVFVVLKTNQTRAAVTQDALKAAKEIQCLYPVPDALRINVLLPDGTISFSMATDQRGIQSLDPERWAKTG